MLMKLLVTLGIVILDFTRYNVRLQKNLNQEVAAWDMIPNFR